MYLSHNITKLNIKLLGGGGCISLVNLGILSHWVKLSYDKNQLNKKGVSKIGYCCGHAKYMQIYLHVHFI